MMVARQLGWLMPIAIGLAWIAVACADHPLHSSRATVEFNSDTSSWEVSLCVFPDDLANALKERSGQPVRLDRDSNLDLLIRDYVAEHFQLRLDSGRPIPMHWLGHELETQQAWLYFEFPIEERSPSDTQIKNSILMERFDDQINIAYVRLDGRQRCLTFRTDTPSWNAWTVTRQTPPE